MRVHTNEKYKQMIKRFSPKSPCLKNCVFAFLTGGGICFLSQWLFFLYERLSGNEELAGTLVTVTLIFLASLFTALGIFDRIAKKAGAGTLLPVTGFANATVSPALTLNEMFFSTRSSSLYANHTFRNSISPLTSSNSIADSQSTTSGLMSNTVKIFYAEAKAD